MKLTKVKIEDFKSIKSLEVNIHDLTCLVGQNESGKSNILQAISYLNFSKNKLTSELLNKNSKNYETMGFPSINGRFSIDETDFSILEKFFTDLSEDLTPIINIDHISILITSDTIEGVNILFHEKNKNIDFHKTIRKPENINIFKMFVINDLMPSIELFTTDDLELQTVTSQQITELTPEITPFLKLLSIGGIKDPKILLGDPDKGSERILHAQDKITELFLEFYSQDPSIKIEIIPYNNTWNVKFFDDTKRRYSLKEKSVGFRYFFAFFINKYFAIENADNDAIYLLDEPGVSLHPKGARDLLEIFDEIVATDQIIYTTHNPFLTMRGNTDKLMLVKKDGANGSSIHHKSYANKYEILRKELGLLLNDSFLVGECNIVVEGVSDKFVLHYLIEEIDEFERLKWINIFSADSSSEVIPSVRYLKSLNLQGVVLLDDDDAAKKEITKTKFKDIIIDSSNWDFITVTCSKGESFTGKTLEDIFDFDNYLKAYNTYYIIEWENLESLKPFQQFTTNKKVLPILDGIKTHHKEYFGTEQINKVGVFRKLFELYPIGENLKSYQNAINLVKAIDKAIQKLN